MLSSFYVIFIVNNLLLISGNSLELYISTVYQYCLLLVLEIFKW